MRKSGLCGKEGILVASNLFNVSRKLITALNERGYLLTLANKPFIGNEGKVVNYYVVNHGVYDENKRKYTNQELYGTASIVRIALFLRDMWYIENGWDLPTDQEKWNQIRKEISFYYGSDGFSGE